MTMKEFARIANVSVSTVSKAFHNADDISPETKEYIFSLAREHGCFGKFYKGKYHKKIIAIICPELEGNYYSCFLNHLKNLIESSGSICVISTDDFNTSKQAELIEYYSSYLRVDGLIVFSLKAPLKKGYDIPIVSLFHTADSGIDSVQIDMAAAIHDAVTTLTEMGHLNIAFIGEKLTRGKAEYFKKETTDIGLSDKMLYESPKRFEAAGADGVKALIDTNLNFSAIICAYDHIAFGAIKQLKKMGFSVPQDVSVIGIDNIHTSEWTETSLTSIDVYPEEVCRIVWDLMEKKLKNKYFKSHQNITISPRIIIRESIKART